MHTSLNFLFYFYRNITIVLSIPNTIHYVSLQILTFGQLVLGFDKTKCHLVINKRFGMPHKRIKGVSTQLSQGVQS